MTFYLDARRTLGPAMGTPASRRLWYAGKDARAPMTNQMSYGDTLASWRS
jgi:hypothetical protein